MTLPPAQIAILTDALGLVRGRPVHTGLVLRSPNVHGLHVRNMALADLAAAGFLRQCDADGEVYRVTGKGVRAVCPDAQAAIYEPMQAPVTVFVGRTGRLKMRWDGADQGRFEQGSMYGVSEGAVRFLEPEAKKP